LAIATVVRHWCDLCLADGRNVEAVHRQVPVSVADDVGALDLCVEHRAMIEAVRRALTARAKPTRQPPKGRDTNRHRRGVGPYRCLVPDCLSTPLKHRGTLWQHVRGVHEITLDEYVERYGEPTPLTPEELAALVVEAHCPVEGCDTVYSTADGYRWPQMALVSHTWGHHGIKLRDATG
jgi:hypothetical protein